MPLTPNKVSPYDPEDGKGVGSAVLNQEEGKIYGTDGRFGFICESCSASTFLCMASCEACEGNQTLKGYMPQRNYCKLFISFQPFGQIGQCGHCSGKT